MLEIESEKGLLELDESVVVDFESNFNLNDFDIFKETFSWRFKLKKSPNNWQTLNWLWVAENSLQDSTINVRIMVFGSLWKTGPLYFLDEDSENWDVSFTGEVGSANAKIESRLLKDINWPVVNIVDIYSHAEDTINDPIGTHDYVFAPVDLPSLGQFDWYPAQINSVTVDSNGDFDQFPQFWRTFGNIDEYDPDRLALGNQTSIGYLAGEYVKYAGLYYIANQNVNTGSMNSPDNNPSVWTQATQGNVKQFNPIVPFFYALRVVELIAEDLGIFLSGDIFHDEEARRVVLFNTKCLNSFLDGKLDQVFSNVEIVYHNHLPDIGVSEFIKEIAKFFNQRIDISEDGNTITFEHRMVPILSSPQDVLRNQLLKADQVRRESRGYNISQSYSTKDAELADSTWTGTLEGLTFSRENQDIRLSFSTLPMTTGFANVDPSNEWFAGDMWRPISSLDLNSEVPLQLLVYRGKHLYTNGPGGWTNDPEIPVVTSDLSYNPVGGILDNYSLLIQGDNGIYQTWWKQFIDSMSLFKVFRIYVLIWSHQFSQIDFKKRQALWQYVGLIEKMKLSIGPATREIIAEVQFVGR